MLVHFSALEEIPEDEQIRQMSPRKHSAVLCQTETAWTQYGFASHEPTLEYMYLKVLGSASLGLSWDLFLELHSEVCVCNYR